MESNMDCPGDHVLGCFLDWLVGHLGVCEAARSQLYSYDFTLACLQDLGSLRKEVAGHEDFVAQLLDNVKPYI